MIEASSVKLTDKMVLRRIDKEKFYGITEYNIITVKEVHKVVKKLQDETKWDKKECIQKVVEAISDLASELGLGREFLKYYLPKLYRKDTEQVRAQIFKLKSVKAIAPVLTNIYFRDADKINNIISLTVAVQNLTLTHPKSLNWFDVFEVFTQLESNVLEYRGTDRYLHEVKSQLILNGRSNADSVILRALVDLNVKSFMGDTKLHMFTIIRRLLGEKEYLRVTSEFAHVWEKSFEEFSKTDYPTLIESIRKAKESDQAIQHCVHVLSKINKSTRIK